MEVSEALLKRRSVRKFTEEKIDEDVIDQLMHAAMSGPSACNKKPWEFYVVTNADILEKLYGAAHYSKIKAPLAIIVVGNLSKALPLKMAEYWVQDCSAATENILLKVTDLNLGAVWCGIYPQKTAQKKVSKILGLPLRQVPLNIIYVGHPSEVPELRDQFEENNVHYLR